MNIQQIQSALQSEGVDGWLFYDHHRRDPLAYRILGLPDTLQPTRRWYYLIPASGEPKALVHRVEPHSLDSVPGTKIPYSRWTEQQTGLKDLLSGLKRVAMQYSHDCAIPYVSLVDAGAAELVRSCGVEIVTSADLVQAFEARWTKDQLQSHLDAGKKMDSLRAAAFQYVGDCLRSDRNISEYEVQQFLREGFHREGMITDHGPIVAVNDNASDPHYEPTAASSRPIHKGDLVLIDMWAKFDRPHSVYYDITWTGYVGSSVPEKIAEVFSVVSGGRDAAIAKVKSSAPSGSLYGFEVDDAARNYINGRGFGDYFVHRTGHSIGEDVHGTGANMDNFETHDDRRVIPGTCFSVEPGVYLPEFGIRSEVNMYIGETEAIVTGEIQTEVLRLL